jgi:hypothetical protein
MTCPNPCAKAMSAKVRHSPSERRKPTSNNKQTNAKSPKPVKGSESLAIMLTKATTCSPDKGRR